MIKKLLRYCVVAIAILMLVIACNSDTQSNNTQVAKQRSPSEENVLQIWWERGFNIQEDEALQKLLSNWERKTGNKIDLFFSGTDELLPKAKRALESGELPDLILSFKAERSVSGRLAWDGKLADVSD
ncbi:MAG: carbohydrate ABC transporter substrate-binding protein, partial [Waterburya sp.]